MADAEAPPIPTMLARPEPQAVPGLKDLAQNITDPLNVAQKVVQMAPPPPTADDIRDAKLKADDARQDMRRKQTSYEEYSKPQMEEYRLQSQKYADDAKKNLPQQAQIPQQPKRGLEPFLATRENESPEATIGKLIQAISLFATMAGGGPKGARPALAAMTGALEGWSAGNRYKADKEYQAWRDASEVMFRQFDDEMRAYNSLMLAERIPLEQKLRMLELSAYEHKNSMLASEFQVAEADKVTAALEKRQDAYQKVLQWYSDVVARKDEADLRHQERLDKQKRDFDQHIELLKTRQMIAQQARAGAGLSALDEDTINRLANQRAMGAPLNELVRGIGKDATAVGFEIDKRATKILSEGGQDPAQAAMIAAASKRSNQMTLTDLSKKEANWSQFERAFQPAVQRMLAVAAKVDQRSGMPAIDKYLLRWRAEYAADPDVGALQLQMETVAQEFSRVVQRQGLTTEGTRKEARKHFDVARTPEQLKRVVDEILMPDVEFARQGFVAEKARILHDLANPPKPPKPGEAPPQQAPGKAAPPKAGMVRVKRKSDGAPGWLDPSDLKSGLYEEVK